MFAEVSVMFHGQVKRHLEGDLSHPKSEYTVKWNEQLSRPVFIDSFPIMFYAFYRRAFLFTLINKQGIPATKFLVTKPQCATVHHPK